MILLEVLQGMESEARATAMESWLRAFEIMAVLDEHFAIRAARNYQLLRQRGITIRKTADLLIGTFCLDRGWPLLHADRDFDHMAQHLGLLTVTA